MFLSIQYVGHQAINCFQKVGVISIFAVKIISRLIKRPVYFKLVFQQMVFIGYFSLPIVAMTSAFSGAVLVLQSYIGFARFFVENSIATVVVVSITRELAPVLISLVIAGRVGASIAAEISTMKVTEQIDALFTLSTDPLDYLVVPRLVASVITLPLLVLVGDIIGVLSAYFISVYKFGFNGITYIKNTVEYLRSLDILLGIVKSVIFGFIMVVVSCYQGCYSNKGAKGVGLATTNAVVFSSVLILFSNYFITELFLK